MLHCICHLTNCTALNMFSVTILYGQRKVSSPMSLMILERKISSLMHHMFWLTWALPANLTRALAFSVSLQYGQTNHEFHDVQIYCVYVCSVSFDVLYTGYLVFDSSSNIRSTNCISPIKHTYILHVAHQLHNFRDNLPLLHPLSLSLIILLR